MTADGEASIPDRRRRTVLISAGITVLVVVVVSILFVAGGPTSEGFRVRAESMVPSEPFEPRERPCPEAPSSSPFSYAEDSALIDRLEVYGGELIVVRLTVSPHQGPVPDQVSFSASWPTSVVDPAGPVCAFIVADDTSAPLLTWRATGEATAAFELDNALRYGPTVIEVWLAANDPSGRDTLVTRLQSPEPSDDIVLDPLGGRVEVAARPGVPASVALSTDQDSVVEGRFTATATVANDTERDRSLDVILRLVSSAESAQLSVVDDPVGVECTETGVLLCEVDEIGPGERVSIDIRGELAPEARPEVVPCGSLGSAIGVCLTATAESGSLRTSSTPDSATLLFGRSDSASGELIVTAASNAVARRVGADTTFVFRVRGPDSSDIASVEIVGSDCEEIERIPAATDNGDAFLDPGEEWSYSCTILAESPDVFRLEVAGVDRTGQRVTGSYRTIVETVDPQLSFDVAAEADGSTTVTVTNVGRGDLLELAFSIPGCFRLERSSTDPQALGENDQLTVRCSEGSVDPDLIAVYGSDVGGGTFVARASETSG